MRLSVNENSVIKYDFINIENLNRYPSQDNFINKLADYLKVDIDNIVIGCGSSQLINMCMVTYLQQGDISLIPSPSFNLYDFFTKNRNGISHFLELKNYQYDKDDYISKIKEIDPRVIIICNPNNPTGSVLQSHEIEEILKSTNNYVIVDEAYYEFYGKSMIHKINDYPNLIVLRSFSKAFGLASARLGYLIANKNIIKDIQSKLNLYTVPSISLTIGCLALDNANIMEESVKEITKNRDTVYKALLDMDIKAYQSHGNYIMFEIDNHKQIYEKLLERGIEIRYFDFALRVTIGTHDENNMFLSKLNSVIEEIYNESIKAS